MDGDICGDRRKSNRVQPTPSGKDMTETLGDAGDEDITSDRRTGVVDKWEQDCGLGYTATTTNNDDDDDEEEDDEEGREEKW